MAAGVVHIPWYATFFRDDRFAEALAEVGPVALRYGATDFSIQRSKDDKYKFLHLVSFDSKLDWERFWNSREMCDFREEYSSWYQVPVLYVWHEVVASGKSELQPVVEPEPVPEPDPEPSAAA